MRPALDLIARIGDLPAGEVVDLGCGDGAVADALRAAFAGHVLVGVDSSSQMLAAARAGGRYDRLEQADIAGWAPERAPALIYSNAALNWVPDHAGLLPRLAAALAPGGVLAVQVPGQHGAPSHALMHQLALRLAPGWFEATPATHVRDPAEYHRLLMPLGAVLAWETTYVQHLPPTEDLHPVLHFTRSTAMRPYLQALDPADHHRFLATLAAAMHEAYPPLPDGSVLMPFRRVFFVLRVPHGRA
ncbi:MAG: methyltransferase domain-containing protein [Gemmobacter sp.]|uniref:methyltransferase domain-containing protein n=1 Tax=Gemmobacter sp. TaxID=1898957 RepID=UPI00391A9CC2